MASLSDLIEKMLKEMMEAGDGAIEINRNELAQQMNCAPSQITYVLTTRFTNGQGYYIESRRGGGGSIRIRQLQAQQDCEGLLAKQGLSKQAAEELLEAAILKLAFDATVSVSTKISVRADLSDENTFSAQFLQNFKCPNCQRRLEVLEPLALAANTQFKGFYNCPEHGRFVLHFHLHGAPRRSGREQAKPQQRFMRRLPPLKPKPARGQVYGLTLKFVHDEGWASQGVD